LCDLEEAIEEVVLSPDTEEWSVDTISSLPKKFGFQNLKVRESEIQDLPPSSIE
jgi:hypothetical protein